MAESSEDSELAAMLDEGLFPEDHIPDIEEAEDSEPAETADEDDFAAAVAADSSSPADEYAEAQAAKRPRTAAQEGVTHTSNAASAQQHSGEAICPPHPGWWMNMCIRCGAVKQESAAPASAGGAAAAGAGNGSSGLTRIKHLHHRQALEVGCRVRWSVAAALLCWQSISDHVPVGFLEPYSLLSVQNRRQATCGKQGRCTYSRGSRNGSSAAHARTQHG